MESKANSLFVLIIITFWSLNLVSAQSNFNTTDDYRGERYATITAARGLLVDEAGDILVVSHSLSRITAVYETENTVNQAILLNNAGLALTHGITYGSEWLYASSSTTVFRWPYTPGQRTGITSAEQIVIKNIPSGVHITRTLVFDKEGLLYVSVGSAQNVDSNSDQARIRRFNISLIPEGGIEFTTGTVFADGLRNEVGLAFDKDGILWGVQNGADDLYREDLGGDIHNTNPAEEMTKFDQPLGTHYGYPYCWTVDELDGYKKGDQFAWPTFMDDGVHTDGWCKNVTNNRPPTFTLPAHYAPLGITFYDGKACNTSVGAFPCNMIGDAFVAFHGSWNKVPDEGFKVVRIPFDPETNLPSGEILDIITAQLHVGDVLGQLIWYLIVMGI